MKKKDIKKTIQHFTDDELNDFIKKNARRKGMSFPHELIYAEIVRRTLKSAWMKPYNG